MIIAATRSSSRVILAAAIVLTVLPGIMMLIFLWTQVSVVVRGWFQSRRHQAGRDGVSTGRTGTLDGIVTVSVPEMERKEKDPSSEFPRMMK